MTRAAIYARYSSENQRDASIEDQVRQCRARIKQEGWQEAEVYSDPAISGATTLRPGYQKMLEDARAGCFEVLVAEALDRLSRDQENIAGLFKQLSFARASRVVASVMDMMSCASSTPPAKRSVATGASTKPKRPSSAASLKSSPM